MRLPRMLGHVGLQVWPLLAQLTVHEGQFAIEQHVEIHCLLVICSLDSLMKKRKLTTHPGMRVPCSSILEESYTPATGVLLPRHPDTGGTAEEKRHWPFRTWERA